MQLSSKNHNAKRCYEALLLTVAYFLMLLVYINKPIFASDEAENFLKGSAITEGRFLYGNIGTQHMPLMYYLSAFFSLLGAVSVPQFRICFYILMACLWGLMYFLYSDKLGARTVALYPIIYIVIIGQISHGTTILSEQMQSIGFAILLLELMIFYNTRIIKTSNCVMISLAILLSFGAAFVSIFCIFAFFLTVLLLEIHTCFSQKLGIVSSFVYLLKKFWKLVLIVLLPFIILCLYFWGTNSLRAFYGWAYYLNRHIYTKYYGYGSDILYSMFCGISGYANIFSLENISISTLWQLFPCIFACAAIVMIHIKKRDTILTTGLVFILITAATRGVFNFHSLGSVSLICVLSAITLNALIESIHFNRSSLMRRIVAVICTLSFCGYYISLLPQLFKIDMKSTLKEGSTEYYIDLLTEDGERVGICSLANNVLLSANVIPAMVNGGSTPWLWEYGGEQAMAELVSDPPRVYYLNPEYSVWNYSLKDYAPELIEYIENNYTPLSIIGQVNIYVLNDYYNEAVDLCCPDSLLTSGIMTGVTITVSGGNTISQTFTAGESGLISELEVAVGTFGKSNSCTLDLRLTDNTTGSSTTLTTVSCSKFADNKFNKIEFTPVQIEANHNYTLSFTSADAYSGNEICIYYNTEPVNADMYAVINTVPQEYNLCIKLSMNSTNTAILED